MSRIGQRSRVWAAALFLPAIAFSQVNTATIYGTVTDPSGAAVAQATVNATNQQTGGSWNATTNGNGAYTLTFLPAGKYTLLTRAKGFKEARNTDVELSGGQEVRLTHSLVLGEVTDTVTVSAETPIVNTANAEQTHNLNALRMTELPTVNRDWSAMLNLGAGITVSGSAVSLNGLPQDGFRFTVDGANASGSGESRLFFSPVPMSME